MVTMLECLVAAIFFEARDQPLEGQFAVAEVVKNRVDSPRWPNDYCGVVYQKKQFSFTHDGMSDNPLKYLTNNLEKKAYEIAKQVAIDVDMGKGIGLQSTHYHRKDIKPYWTKHYLKDGTIGEHTFYTAVDGR
jgi:spore germination cell wall hydrolase CwlJ-like protein